MTTIESLPTLEAQIETMLVNAGVKHIRSVMRTEDGQFTVMFTVDGWDMIDSAMQLIGKQTDLQVVGRNGKSITLRHIPSYPRYKVGQKVARKSDGVVFEITTVEGDYLTSKAVIDEGDEPVPGIVNMHSKHFRLVGEETVSNQPSAASETPLVTDVVDKLLEEHSSEGEAPSEQDSVSEESMKNTDEWVHKVNEEAKRLDDKFASHKQRFMNRDPKFSELASGGALQSIDEALDDASPEPFADDDLYEADALDFPELTPEQRLVLSGHAPETPPIDEPPIDDDDTEELDPVALAKIAALQSEIADLRKQLADREIMLAVARDMRDSYAEKLAAVVRVECEETHETPAAEYARRRNAGWRAVQAQRENGKLWVMWERDVQPPSALEDPEAVVAKPTDAFEMLPVGTQAYSLSEMEDPFNAVPTAVMSKMLRSVTS